MKWLATNADDPSIVLVVLLTVSLPAVVIIAILAAVLVSRREHPELASALTVVAYVSFFATLVWWGVLAPWNGDL